MSEEGIEALIEDISRVHEDVKYALFAQANENHVRARQHMRTALLTAADIKQSLQSQLPEEPDEKEVG